MGALFLWAIFLNYKRSQDFGATFSAGKVMH
jgi:hypothetical protein